MKKSKLVCMFFMVMLMGMYTHVIYANDNCVNVKESTYEKNGKTYDCLSSEADNGYLQITQIIQNSQNVKLATSTFDNKLLISGIVKKDTEVSIKVYKKDAEDPETEYTLTSTGKFSQSVEIPEGENRIMVSYKNGSDKVEDYIVFIVSRGSEESMEAIKGFIVNA